MKISGLHAVAYGLVVASLLVSCSGGGGGGGGSGNSNNDGPMFIQNCSLGCSSGAGGLQVNCSVVQVSLDTEIAVVFSQAVDPASVNSTTFQLIDVGSGDVPIGSRFVDASNPRRVVFRPTINFDNQGTASFGFAPLRTYRITIPGVDHGDVGPFVRSLGGKANVSRMECDIQTTTQIDDLVPGPPTVSMFVSVLDPANPGNVLHHQPASGAVDVWHDSTVEFLFNDIMNPSTLANPVTHQSPLINIKVDSDGNLGTTQDQITLYGSYVVTIDLNLFQTTMTFTPTNGMPSAGSLPPNPTSPRKILVNIPSGVQDLAANNIANPGTILFTPELVQYDPITLPDDNGENFTSVATRDAVNSGADWGQGRLNIGWGGGSGRLGALRVATLQTVVLDTDGTVFKNFSTLDPETTMPIVATSGFLDNSRPKHPPTGPAEYEPLDTHMWPTVTVSNGIFEFSSLIIDSGGTLKFVGTRPGRLYSRGPVTIEGSIDIRGESPSPHLSDDPIGELGAEGGINAGSGGKGGDRPDNTGHDDILELADVPGSHGGIPNVGAVIAGSAGGGVGNTGNLAAGKGGRHYPNPFPTSTENFPSERGGLLYTGIVIDAATTQCRVRQVASPGGGGGYAISGGRGVPMTPDPDAYNPNPPPDTVSNLPANTAPGGDAAALGIEPPDPQSGHVVRCLTPANLRGGSGGGGGGAHLYDTFQDFVNPAEPGVTCYDDFDEFSSGITDYLDHSACGGGGGGGATQVVSGEVMRVAGTIVASGGDGGSNMVIEDETRSSRAAPGGGGSGGAIKLQAKVLNIDPNVPGRLNVSGGAGGINSSLDSVGEPTMLGRGGIGAPGLIRLEDISGGINPPATLMSRCSEAPKLLPFVPNDPNPNTPSGQPCFGFTESEDFLSVATWAQPRKRPDSYSGAVSCWIRPQGDFFVVQFDQDDVTDPQNPILGWNMKVLYGDPSAGPPILLNYRGPDPNSPYGSDFETILGSEVNYLDDVNPPNPPGNQFGTGPYDPAVGGTYLTVRFQGALAIADISSNACNVPLTGVGSKIALGSLTPWVRHPAELNQFLPRPNMIRFCVVFDRSVAQAGTPAALVQGVTNLLIHAQPD